MQCPKCGSGVPDGSTQCHICYAPLGEGAASAAPAPTMAPPPQPAAEAPASTPGLPGIYSQAAAGGGAEAPQGLGGGIPGLRPAAEEPQQEVRPSYLSPNASMPSQPMGGEMRVSLTGEMIPSAPPAPATYGPAAAPQPPGRTPPPRPGAPARPQPYGSRQVQASRTDKRSGGGAGAVIAILLVLILLGGGGFGGWWYYTNVMNGPAAAVKTVLQAFKQKDWKTVYQNLDYPDELKQRAASMGMTPQQQEDQFTAAMGMVGSMLTLKDYQIGDTTVNGDTATVKVTSTWEMSGMLAAMPGVPKSGSPVSQDVTVKKVDGKWKVSGGPRGGGLMPGAPTRARAGGANRRSR